MIAAVLAAAALAAPAPQLLVVTETRGFVHDSIPAAKAMVASLGYRTRFLAGARQLTAARLRGAGAVVFLNTSGELRLDAAGRRRLLDYVRDGGAFVGAHAAAATFPGSPAFHRMLGADFLGHAPAGPGRVDVTDRAFTRGAVVRGHRRVLQVPRSRQAPCRRARARRRSARVVAALRARARVLRRAGALPGHVERAPPGPAHDRRDPLGARVACAIARPLSCRFVERPMPLRRLLPLAALALALVPTAPAAADQAVAEIGRAAPVAGYGGWEAWSAFDEPSGRYILTLRDPASGALKTPLPSSKRPWDVSLGPDAHGNVVAIYQHCASSGCDIRRMNVATGTEQATFYCFHGYLWPALDVQNRARNKGPPMLRGREAPCGLGCKSAAAVSRRRGRRCRCTGCRGIPRCLRGRLRGPGRTA